MCDPVYLPIAKYDGFQRNSILGIHVQVHQRLLSCACYADDLTLC